MPVSRRKSFAHIEGLEEFIRDAGVAERNMKDAEKVFMAVAATTVAEGARQMGREQGGVAEKAATDVRVAALGTVAYGGEAYSFGAEFGAIQWKQFDEWRGNGTDAGYFFWPAIREFRDEKMLDQWVKHVWENVKFAFPESK